jgi:hypothetical protein
VEKPSVRRDVPAVGQPGLLEGGVEGAPVAVAFAVDKRAVDVEDDRGQPAHVSYP